MERLTIRGEDGKAYWVDARCAGGGYRMTNDKRDQARLDRLAAYEDTGLEPEEITVKPYPCVFYCNRRCTLDNDWCAEGPGCQKEMGREEAAHLRELVQAEQDGRCVVLPQVSEQDRRGMADFLHDCFAEWTHDPSVGLYGMTDGEAALASAFMAALGGTHCEAERGRQEANKRLRSLDEEYQANIAGKYYNGEMPWRKE